MADLDCTEKRDGHGGKAPVKTRRAAVQSVTRHGYVVLRDGKPYNEPACFYSNRREARAFTIAASELSAHNWETAKATLTFTIRSRLS